MLKEQKNVTVADIAKVIPTVILNLELVDYYGSRSNFKIKINIGDNYKAIYDSVWELWEKKILAHDLEIMEFRYIIPSSDD